MYSFRLIIDVYYISVYVFTIIIPMLLSCYAAYVPTFTVYKCFLPFKISLSARTSFIVKCEEARENIYYVYGIYFVGDNTVECVKYCRTMGFGEGIVYSSWLRIEKKTIFFTSHLFFL